ncbi:putative glycosyl hydrolase, family 18 [Annulohypoxylon maeteangense]|uniref:putative glycosyl hydrolase, family 18 n=1 Tax=Annulohypoxylon maeteangense TaxID=1927788 RepID=UPI002007F8C3|nr:putative glycosyl hydrolase, family 18 [Annulohypoxylon maeteangense]KAI0882847.1 putative glycosyl hydrolase, family 18 [Annulohypoxylon maeteangense]
MRASLLVPLAILASEAFASQSHIEIPRRDADAAEIESWFATAQRASLDTSKKCPVSCSETKDSSSSTEWYLFPDAAELASCNETMLLNMAVKTTAEDQATSTAIRACTADYDSGVKAAFVADENKASLCVTSNRVLEEGSVYMHEAQVGSNAAAFSVNHLLAAGNQISRHLALQVPSCVDNAIEFAYSQSAAIGVFAGVEVHQHGITSDVLENLLKYAEEKAISKPTIVQLCGSDGRGADYSLGIVTAGVANLPFIQEAVKTWSEGECVAEPGAGESWMSVTLRVPSPVEATSNSTTNSTTSSSTTPASLKARSLLDKRADCKTTKVQSGDGCWAVSNRCGISQADLEKYNRANLCSTLILDEIVCCSSGTLPSTIPPGNSDGTCKTRTVVSGDSCGSLASKCGISAADFMKVNTKTNLCSTLAEGQQVCCTAGSKPDLKPKPDADGYCATYTTVKNDYCAKIAAARDLTVKDLEDFNKKTWGWNGCEDGKLLSEFNMCVSTGSPPMPMNVPNAVCGPTVNDTARPSAGTDLSTLNPCPLNVCCNIWGQCGMTDDFCVKKDSETGAPGTSGAKNGCISNCGRDIIKGSAPAEKIKVAYFEAWNHNRECLTMDVDQIDTDAYTHIHFSFADITANDFAVDISKVQEQFDIFKGMSGVKKIISFGGWDFSTLPGTFNILRTAVQPGNRDKFKKNLIAFVNDNNLDGIDLDWEYPGAPDIPDIPSDDPVNGKNYYEFLSDLKKSIGSSKSVSFAAPASYWYLKAYPIKQMAAALDYIIYMTYDLHGQWDYGNKWSSPGCESGNCLRSHVNETETKDALSMITKAGAASNKVVVGVASYGRSFKMAEAGCDSETCLFTGTNRISNAAKGRCTDTGGYISNAEIDEIIQSGKVTKQWKKEGSNILVYNDTEWVAYMDDDMKKSRAEFYDSYNFAGTTDWAVDLQYFADGSGGDDYDDDYEYEIDEAYWTPCQASYSTLDQLDQRKDSTPAHCIEQYLLDIQVATLEAALNKYEKLIADGYDHKFSIYEKYVTAQVPGQVDHFMASDKVQNYFTCKETKDITCCSSCRYSNCVDTCVKGSDCKNGRGTIDIKCPQMETQKSMLDGTAIPNATFTLKDADGFWKDIGDEFGIDESWIKFGRRLMRVNNGCQYAGEKVNECQDKQNNFFYNYPLADKVSVYNPKEVIGDSFPKATDMLDRFKTVRMYGNWDDLMELTDLVDATSLPGYSTEEAVASMEKIVEQAGEIEKKQREEFILNFITGLLFWIPIVGEAIGAAGMTTVRSLLRLIGSTGDAGLAVYDIVNNPENAFMAVFSYLAGAGLGRAGFRNAANSRRGLSSSEYDSLGGVKTKLDLVQNIRGNICPR